MIVVGMIIFKTNKTVKIIELKRKQLNTIKNENKK